LYYSIRLPYVRQKTVSINACAFQIEDMRQILTSIVIVLLTFTGIWGQTGIPKDFDGKLDSFARKIQRDLKIKTGFAIGVVKDGQLVSHRQYGFLNVEKRTPVRSDTPFYIASTTKVFVSLLSVILAEKGYFKLDEPISTYLPELVFADKRLNADRITIRNLLTHVHGISNGVLEFNTTYTGLKTSDKELIEAFRKESSFSTNDYLYANRGYILTGIIIKRTTGKSWQENLKKYVLQPANLTRTSPYLSDFDRHSLPAAHSSPRDEDKVLQEPFIKVDQTMHAAGGMLSTVPDISKWLIIHMDKGKYQSVRIFPEDYIDEIVRKQVGLQASFFNYSRNGYSLGWYHALLDKYEMLQGFGGFAGARSHISFLPNEKIGVCVFINESSRGSGVQDLMANYAYGLLLDDPNVISATESELDKRVKAFQAAIAARPSDSPAVEIGESELRKFAGAYFHGSFGTLEIKTVKGRMFIELGNVKTFARPTGKTSFVTDFPYFLKLEFIKDGVEMDNGTRYLFSPARTNK
jgi:CubicO group peptidase (beta-lactamase class C family)